MKKTWDRGKKKLTPLEKIESQNWQRTRVKIINMIARKPEIQKICCICGKEGKTLHNRKNPYYITFICDKCKKDSNNLIIAEESRFDVRDRLDKYSSNIMNYNEKQIISIIENFIGKGLTIGEYCEQEEISRFKLNKILDKYCQITLNYQIKDEYKKQISKNAKTKGVEKYYQQYKKEDIKKIVEEFYKKEVGLKKYCKENNISMKGFFYFQKKYFEITGNSIYENISEHFKKSIIEKYINSHISIQSIIKRYGIEEEEFYKWILEYGNKDEIELIKILEAKIKSRKEKYRI